MYPIIAKIITMNNLEWIWDLISESFSIIKYPMIPDAPQMKTFPMKVKVVPSKCKSPNFIGFVKKSWIALTQEVQNGSEEITT